MYAEVAVGTPQIAFYRAPLTLYVADPIPLRPGDDISVRVQGRSGNSI